MALRRAAKRTEADARNAATPPERRASYVSPDGLAAPRRRRRGQAKESPHVVTCALHGKQGYFTRKAARKAAREYHPGEALSEYECSTGTGLWHFGHTPAAVIERGTSSRRDLIDAAYRKKDTA